MSNTDVNNDMEPGEGSWRTVWLILLLDRTRRFLIRCPAGVKIVTLQPYVLSRDSSCWPLPASKLDGQDEQDAEHDGPAEQTRSPGHENQQVPEGLSHPAQHYRPIYRPLLLPNTSMRQTEAGRKSVLTEMRAKLDWTSML